MMLAIARCFFEAILLPGHTRYSATSGDRRALLHPASTKFFGIAEEAISPTIPEPPAQASDTNDILHNRGVQSVRNGSGSPPLLASSTCFAPSTSLTASTESAISGAIVVVDIRCVARPKTVVTGRDLACSASYSVIAAKGSTSR
jgi:hypothetical protein